MPQLVHGFFHGARQQQRAILREAVKFLPQPCERNDRNFSVQLRKAVHKTEHGDKQIFFGDGKQLDGIRRACFQQFLQDHARTVLLPFGVQRIHRFVERRHSANLKTECMPQPHFKCGQNIIVHVAGVRHMNEIHTGCPVKLGATLAVVLSSTASGSVTVNTVPLPKLLFTSSSPPCASTMP